MCVQLASVLLPVILGDDEIFFYLSNVITENESVLPALVSEKAKYLPTYFLFVKDFHCIVGFVPLMLHEHHPAEAPRPQGLYSVKILEASCVLQR